MNKTVVIRGKKYRMRQASTGWVFVYGKKGGKFYDIAKIERDHIIQLSPREALRYASNEELAQAWVKTP